MDELLKQTMISTKCLANFLKINQMLSDDQKDVLVQTVQSGQILVQGLSQLRKKATEQVMSEGDEYLCVYFSEQAEIFIRQNESFIKSMEAVTYA